jgi:hypothetical protein
VYAAIVGRLKRTVGLGVAVLIALHAAVLGNVTRICRHTGEKVNCDCPHHREKAQDRLTLGTESCCQIRSVTSAASPAIVKVTPPAREQSVEVWIAPKPFQILSWGGSDRYVAARQQGPPSTPIYISIRNLLI